MSILTNLNIQRGTNALLFDGVLSDGVGQKHYVEGAPFSLLSIGNYMDKESHDVSGQIWIQTLTAKAKNTWYELKNPSDTYSEYWKMFVWLANLAKHVIDFMADQENVVLLDFEVKFINWLKAYHSESESFQKWHALYGKDDFRSHIVVHRDWLWSQVYNGSVGLTRHKLWSEVRLLEAVRPVRAPMEMKTVVTPWVHECFDHMFGDKLKKVTPPPKDVGAKLEAVVIPVTTRMKRDKSGDILRTRVTSVEPGTVVALLREGSAWNKRSLIWYAYVHRVEDKLSPDLSESYTPGLGPELKVIWLYAHDDTILSMGKYPHHNELFFSDHCNCAESVPLYLDDLIGIVPVDFMVGPKESRKEFFVRQKYRTADPAFLTLTEADLKSCACSEGITAYEEVKLNFAVGDTVLLGCKNEGGDSLEPVMIDAFNDEKEMIAVRLFERKDRYDPAARPNEILWTPAVKPVNPDFIFRKCHIQFVSEADVRARKIPALYDRDGASDFFFMTSFMDTDRKIKPYTQDNFPRSLKQGYSIDSPLPDNKPRMKGMDLFCGGGNFGRGLEEGGAIDMKWAVDIDVPAIATYRANLRNQDAALYLGSVNNYMEDAIREKYSDLIARPDDVDFISAGSPCQGFSNANQRKNTDTAVRNCSLVASVATAVDVFRPKHALLENVGGLATTRKLSTGMEVNVFSQLLCCLVGMGYQTQQFTLDAWSFGSAQSRTRLFLNLAAPGAVLPPRPARSHGHPPKMRNRGLFKGPNGDKFAMREVEGPCPFGLNTFKDVMQDLPNLGAGHIGACIQFPDHRHSRSENNLTRSLIAHVPKFGSDRTWRKALDTGVMPKIFGLGITNKSKLVPGCRSWSRIDENGLSRTVTTMVTPQCAYSGIWLHPIEDRLITVMEARRAQSFPDNEVLLGNSVQAWKIVGNSVARSVALAWGISLRYAYLDQYNILRR
ncbi:S-adenosyl-L-methionine-dependent methyltransferase [Choiromyces venosus 120613-1]|uniref:DNA (cytosine-5-)-methyltransferase n=1 Tax=Choiromyces venosus 120613-1 TaxID=1336337 RepID=A0A3N4JMH0_9PEZI|nr:S-adenosyl-L-methionine-dependent methyltransferase [Choiromyces venosus 120613-1]